MSEVLIDVIPVPQNDANAEDPRSACSWVGYFVEEALDRGYDQKELPRDAIRFALLWEYYGEVNNGGHAQCYENEEETRESIGDLAKMLIEIDLPLHGQVLLDFQQLVIENEDTIADLYAADDALTAKEMFYAFDDRFAESERSEGRLADRLRQWLLEQPWVIIEEGQQPHDTRRLRTLITDPPSREDRMEARMRRQHAENHGVLASFARLRTHWS